MSKKEVAKSEPAQTAAEREKQMEVELAQARFDYWQNAAIQSLEKLEKQALTTDDVKLLLGEEPSAEELIQMFRDLKQVHERFDRLKSYFGALFNTYRVSAAVERMEDLDVSSMKTSDMGTIALTDELRVKVLDQDALVKWLEDEGLDDVIKETVNSSTLKAIISRYIKEGKEVPDKIFQINTFSQVTVRK